MPVPIAINVNMLIFRVSSERPAPHEERRNPPQNTRRGEHQRDPVRRWRRPWWASGRDGRPFRARRPQGEHQRDPEPLVMSISSDRGLSSETCSGSSTMPQIGNCRVRPAAPPDASDRCRRAGRCRGPSRAARQEFVRLGFEPLAAAGAAEEKSPGRGTKAVLAGRRIDLHAATDRSPPRSRQRCARPRAARRSWCARHARRVRSVVPPAASPAWPEHDAIADAKATRRRPS